MRTGHPLELLHRPHSPQDQEVLISDLSSPHLQAVSLALPFTMVHGTDLGDDFLCHRRRTHMQLPKPEHLIRLPISVRYHLDLLPPSRKAVLCLAAPPILCFRMVAESRRRNSSIEGGHGILELTPTIHSDQQPAVCHTIRRQTIKGPLLRASLLLVRSRDCRKDSGMLRILLQLLNQATSRLNHHPRL
ncbi:hypothetical protein KC330_g76 [Hortaea werneckii]|nr:hypothetical protein KC330_g76 [Hortaea werneckii]